MEWLLIIGGVLLLCVVLVWAWSAMFDPKEVDADEAAAAARGEGPTTQASLAQTEAEETELYSHE